MKDLLREITRDWISLLRGIVFLLVFSTVFYILFRLIFDHTVAISEHISIDKGILGITTKSGDLHVVNVPSYRIYTESGVYLDKEKKVEIRATGLVTTGLFLDVNKHLPAETSTNDKRFLDNELKRDIILGWRNPNGSLIHRKNELDNIGCLSQKSKKLKALKDENYGMLLSTIIPKDWSLDRFLMDWKNGKNKIIRIGESATIEYDKDKKMFVVTRPYIDDVDQIPSSYDGAQIAFLVNDTILWNEADLSIPNNCKEDEIDDYLRLIRGIHKELYNDTDIIAPESLWLLNNLGSFTVTLLQK